jgi:hypothetical protein
VSACTCPLLLDIGSRRIPSLGPDSHSIWAVVNYTHYSRRIVANSEAFPERPVDFFSSETSVTRKNRSHI